MEHGQNQYWPFGILPLEKQSVHDRKVIQFLDAAYRAGFHPYTFDAGSFGAATSERRGVILVRTRSFWELRIGTTEGEDALVAYVGAFEIAAEAVLRWLGNSALPDVLEVVRPSLIPRGGLSNGYTLGEAARSNRAMRFDFVSDEDGRTRLALADAPEYAVSLRGGALPLPDDVKKGKWLIVSMSVWSMHDIRAGGRAVELAAKHKGAMKIGLRMFKDLDEHATWVPGLGSANLTDRQQLGVTDLGDFKKVAIRGLSDASPIWVAFAEGNVVSVRQGQLSDGEIEELMAQLDHPSQGLDRTSSEKQVADLITVENTPINHAIASDIASQIRIGGEIRLVVPAEYGSVASQRLVQALPKGAAVTQTTAGGSDAAISTIVIRMPGATP